jgi:hypothetical protein
LGSNTKVSVFIFIPFTVSKSNFTVFWKARLEVIVNHYHLKGGKNSIRTSYDNPPKPWNPNTHNHENAWLKWMMAMEVDRSRINRKESDRGQGMACPQVF